RIVHGKDSPLNFLGQPGKSFPRYNGGRGSAFKGPGQMIVSVVTRTVYGHKQFAGTDGSRVNRNPGQNGFRCDGSRGRDTQGCCNLTGGPPHCVSNRLSLRSSLAFSQAPGCRAACSIADP